MKQMRYAQYRAAAILLLPVLLLLFVFRFIPLFMAFFYSLTDYNIISSPNWVGLANFRRLFNDPVFGIVTRNTFYYLVLNVPVGMALSLAVAVALSQKLPGTKTFRVLYYLPVITAMPVAAMVWMLVYHRQFGLLNQILVGLRFSRVAWLQDLRLVMPSLAVVAIWKSLGFRMIIYIAGLKAIPRSLYEAATVDGASSWQEFRFVTWPCLRPINLFILVTGTLASIQVFTTMYIMTSGGPLRSTTTMVMFIYTTAFERLQGGYASAASITLMAMAAIISFINFKFFSGETKYD